MLYVYLCFIYEKDDHFFTTLLPRTNFCPLRNNIIPFENAPPTSLMSGRNLMKATCVILNFRVATLKK